MPLKEGEDRSRDQILVVQMELRGQDKRIAAAAGGGGGGGGVGIPSNFTYGFTSIISATGGVGGGGGGERRSSNNNNNNTAAGNGAVRSTQTLDQFHHHHHHHLLPQLNNNRPSSSSSPQPQPQPPPPQLSSREVLRDEDSDPDPPHPDPVSVTVDASTTTTPPPTPTPTIRYKECLKNHAASIGGHVIDGCGEFMPSSEEGTPGALKCAACDCHRSFHRKEIEGESSQSVTNCYFCYNRNNKTDTKTRALPPPPPQGPPQQPPPPPPATIQHHQKFSSKLPNRHQAGQNQPMMMAFGGGGGTDQSSSEEFNVYQSNVGPGHHQHPSLQPGQPYTMSSSSSKKRFRTKFSQEQKEKMSEFAEMIGWRISKQDDAAVQQFCVEVGVKRQVLKVWMHNNKHISTKKKLEEEL